MATMNGRADVLGGVGGFQGSLNNVPIPFKTFGGGSWLNDDQCVESEPRPAPVDAELVVWTPANGATRPLGRGANDWASNADALVAWLSGYGVWGDLEQRLLPHFGNDPNAVRAHLANAGTYGPHAVGPDGTIAYRGDRYGYSFRLVARDGSIDVDLPLVPDDVQVLGRGVAIYRGGAVGREKVKLAVADTTGVLVATAGDGVEWVYGWSATVGTIVHPNGETTGYIIGDKDFYANYRDIRSIGGEIVIAYSKTPGEAAGDVVVERIDRSKPRVPLVAPPTPTEKPIGPLAPPLAADGQLYDLLSFVLGDPALQARSGPTHQQHQLQKSSGVFYFVKFGNPEAYEMWAHDDDWIYHLEDASGAIENGVETAYRFTDQRWFPRRLAIGESAAFVTGPHETIHYRRRQPDVCAEYRREPYDRKMWLFAVYPSFHWGKDLGDRETIVLVYDPTAGIHNSGRYIELGYYAKGAGSCRWEAHRSDLVYASGKPVFDDSTRTARSDFYLVGAPRLQPSTTGCVAETVPHYPPLGSTPPVDPPKPPSNQWKGMKMDEGTLVALVAPGGRLLAIVNGKPTVYDPNHPVSGLSFEDKNDQRCQFRVSKVADQNKFRLEPVSVPGQRLSSDLTQYQSDVRNGVALSPNDGNYEHFNYEKTVEGIEVFFVRYIEQGVVVAPYLPLTLAVVKI